MILNHRFAQLKDLRDFPDLEAIDFFQEKHKVTFQRKGLGYACKTKGDVFSDLKIPLRRCLPDMHGILKELPVAQRSILTNVRYSFRLAFF